ncbi:hypothetical protein I7I48_05674 [Histoplasma ohiense]|nr:hypothetical protein I7I48_05674 [Histoplasma ohiense (nom. inval.)]
MGGPTVPGSICARATSSPRSGAIDVSRGGKRGEGKRKTKRKRARRNYNITGLQSTFNNKPNDNLQFIPTTL